MMQGRIRENIQSSTVQASYPCLAPSFISKLTPPARTCLGILEQVQAGVTQNMFWATRPEHVLGDHPKLLCQQCFEQLQVHQSMLWATVQNCFKYTKIQGRACSGLQSKLFPKLLQVHKNTSQSMFWATVKTVS